MVCPVNNILHQNEVCGSYVTYTYQVLFASLRKNRSKLSFQTMLLYQAVFKHEGLFQLTFGFCISHARSLFPVHLRTLARRKMLAYGLGTNSEFTCEIRNPN